MHETNLSFVPSRVTNEMNTLLLRPFDVKEIIMVVKQMHPSKALGSDGLPPLFYLKYWHIVSEDVISLVLHVLGGGTMPKDFNHTHICFILKVKEPKYISEYHPISLYDVVAKVGQRCWPIALRVF